VLEAAAQALAGWKDENRPAVADVRYSAPPTAVPDPVTGACIGASTAVSFSFVAEAADVEVDPDTGEVRLRRVIAVQDPGRAVNPQQVRGQMEGGIIQAQGWALMENFIVDSGRVLTDQLSTYLIPTIADVPEVMDCLLFEKPDPEGPWGARGVGEIPLSGMAPAIVIGVHEATGVWFDRLPLTPEAVWLGLQGAGPEATTSRSEQG
jgi:CO/xanthine dehydrogenase Mo-binding subunit